MNRPSWQAPARISVSGPVPWQPVERVEVRHPDGDAVVTVESWPVPPDADLDALVPDDPAPTEPVPGWKDTGIGPATVLGSPEGRSRAIGWTDPDGVAKTATLSYVLDHGRFYAIAQVTAQGATEKIADVAEIVRSISVAAPFRADPEQLPLRPAHADFTAAVAAWHEGGPPTDSPTFTLTTEESFGAARHYGVAVLPGVDTRQWNLLDEPRRDLAAAVAWRSLLTKGAESDPALREALEIAASHDLIVVVTVRGPAADGATRWYAARPDRTVEVRRGSEPGLVELRVVDTGSLAALVMESGPDDTVSASSVHRRQGGVVGQETTWRTVNGALVAADGTPMETADLLARLADLVPTSDPA
jgi:hypothetical protein